MPRMTRQQQKAMFAKQRMASNSSRVVEHGFDLTDFGSNPQRFKSIVTKYNLKERDKVSSVSGQPYKIFVWKGKDVEIRTGNNPITGEYSTKGARPNEKGYASYIGIKGKENTVRKVVKDIKSKATYIKDESKGSSDFI